MKTKDYLIVALAPLAVLLIPFVGVMVSEEWQWTPSDFVLMWCLLAGTIFVYRLLVTRRMANFAYRAGAGLAVAAGFLMIWVTMAVQIIGHENPANLLYAVVVLIGLLGTVLAHFSAAGLAKAAFSSAAATFLVPVIAVILWPADFSPGVLQVFTLNFGFVLMFAASGLLFRHAAGQSSGSSAVYEPGA